MKKNEEAMQYCKKEVRERRRRRNRKRRVNYLNVVSTHRDEEDDDYDDDDEEEEEEEGRMHYYKKGDGREAGAAEGETLDSMNVRPTQVRPEWPMSFPIQAEAVATSVTCRSRNKTEQIHCSNHYRMYHAVV